MPIFMPFWKSLIRNFPARQSLFFWIVMGFLSTWGKSGVAQTNVESLLPWGWSPNTGWLNFSGDLTHGVVATPHYLAGYVWSPNVGWISLGDGTPETGNRYSNTRASDFGVNLDSNGHLSGYAWGQNIGWIRFDDRMGGPGAAAILTPSGGFVGYAWGQNIGWIRLDCDWGVLLADSDEDGLADAFETGTGQYAGAYDTGTAPGNPDSDGDQVPDGDEVKAGSDPTDPGSVPSPEVVWVDLGYCGPETGALLSPFNTVSEAVTGVASGGTIRFYGPSVLDSTSETLRITKPLRMSVYAGRVRIGVKTP